MKKFTFDRVEDDMCVFLERPDEIESILIAKVDCPHELVEGDIVGIERVGDGYKLDVLKEETDVSRDKVQSLLDKLKRK